MEHIFRPFKGRSPGEGFAFLVFLMTCFQAAILVPYIVLVPDERTNMFTALLGGLSLLVCLVCFRNKRPKASPAFWVSVTLVLLVLLSSALSSSPRVSLFRGVAIIATGAGGFWCARMFFQERNRLDWFVGFCLGLITLVIILALTGGFLTGKVTFLMDNNPHQVVCKLFLLAFAPLAMLFTRNRREMLVGGLVLFGAGLVLYLSTLRSAILIPIIVTLVVVITTGRFRVLKALIVILVGAVMFACLCASFPDRQLQIVNYEPVYYRVENYPFSWHIAVHNPLLGNGLCASRDTYLDNYALKFQLVHRGAFVQSVKNIGTSENIFLTFMADLGFPFTILYIVSVIVLFVRIVGKESGWSGVRQNYLLYAVSLAFFSAVLHCFTTDDLLIPQVNWFFHVLLGMISTFPGQSGLSGVNGSIKAQ
ncbi:MAG: hypothetical protein PHR77_11195 [Kiritimatiellae bacterium]|nr:hypothetical protein [Kiritimatiellia bacterium]MDD5521708.1 hypothetical protein [Kiritimatiellia bacterium]